LAPGDHVGVRAEGHQVVGEALPTRADVGGRDLGAPARDPLAHGVDQRVTGVAHHVVHVAPCDLGGRDVYNIPNSRTAVEDRPENTREPPMTELLDRQEFRTALEEAIKGREAKNASFSMAWAKGELTREH